MISWMLRRGCSRSSLPRRLHRKNKYSEIHRTPRFLKQSCRCGLSRKFLSKFPQARIIPSPFYEGLGYYAYDISVALSVNGNPKLERMEQRLAAQMQRQGEMEDATMV